MQLYNDPIQAYNQQSGYSQGGLAPNLLPNQQIKPELDSHIANQGGLIQGESVSPPLQTQPTPQPPPHPTQPKIDSRNKPALSLQHPIEAELGSQMTLPQCQPFRGELDSHTQSDLRQEAYQQPNQTALSHYQHPQAELEHPNRGPPQLGHGSVIYEAL
ncbi:hypothetical protein V491_08055 [Pseudogymnoascus sp. VKM F-3775]|nr:hypothetical protein V491_08055 [Pseudogymnoascus sp. VKM F-3775]